jgi:hypothetical protein
MPDFSRRSNEDEIMDDFGLLPDELHPVLKELDVINRLLGGFSVYYDAFKTLKIESGDAIADWGCGGGDTFKVLQKYPNILGLMPRRQL